MIIVTGLSVTVRTWFRIASPLFGSLVSTSTTPPCVTNTVVFPPAPEMTYRLSRTFLIEERGRPWVATRSTRVYRPAAGEQIRHTEDGVQVSRVASRPLDSIDDGRPW